MARGDLQFAGEFRLEKCVILTTTGTELDISDLVQNIKLYEDIMSATVSGDITIKDTNNLVMNAPINGEEKFLLKIVTPQKNPKPETIIDYVSTPLIIYKINLVAGAGETALIYSLNFTTSESFRNQVSRVSQSYKGQPSTIVEKIVRDENYLASTRKLHLEETANHVKLVYPNTKPINALMHLCKISNSKQINQSPSYTFYETTKGFHFRTIDGLASQEPVMTYEENIPDSLDEKGVINPAKNLTTITHFSIQPTKDTIYNMSEGFYSSKMIVHDLYNKTLTRQDYSYLDNFANDVHTDGAAPLVSSSLDPKTGKNLSQYTDSKLFVTTTSSGKHFYESQDYPYQSDNRINTLQRRASRFNQIMRGIKAHVEVPGQTYIQAGDVVEMLIGATSATTTDKYDTEKSGRYLITTLKHTFNFTEDPRHKIYMECVKDSLARELPNNGIAHSENTSGQTEYV